MFTKKVAKKETVDEKSFTVKEAHSLVTESKGKVVAETFIKQATTYAVFRVLYNRMKRNKKMQTAVAAIAIGKWIYDVYKLACSNVPRHHAHTVSLMAAAKFLGCDENEPIRADLVNVSGTNLMVLNNNSPSTEIQTSEDRDNKVLITLVESFDGHRAAIIHQPFENGRRSSRGDEKTPGVSQWVEATIVSRISDEKSASYWENAVNSYIIRTSGPGSYLATASGGSVSFTRKEFPTDISRIHPDQIESDIGKRLRNAFENRRRHGLIVTGPIGTGKTSSIMNAVSKIPDVYIINVNNLEGIDNIYSCLAGIGDKSIVVFIDDVDRMMDKKSDPTGLMRALDGSCTAAPIVTIMTANDPAGKLPQAIYNRRRRVDSILTTANPSTVKEFSAIVSNACATHKCPEFKIDKKFVDAIKVLGANHADIAAAIEQAKYIDMLEDCDINKDSILGIIRAQHDGVKKALQVSKDFGRAEREVEMDVRRGFNPSDDEE